jgi:hypothetical protein
MMDRSAIQIRYLRDPVPVRLGGLAANLARIESFSDHPAHGDVVQQLIDESKYFIEWTAAEADAEAQAELVELQVQLARWQSAWMEIWPDPSRRAAVASQSGAWSRRIMEISGLLAA